MEPPVQDDVIGLRIARSDVAFLHDSLMSGSFQGSQMLQAAGIVSGLRRALLASVPASAEAPTSLSAPASEVSEASEATLEAKPLAPVVALAGKKTNRRK